MTPIDQTVVEKEKGNCMQAVAASLLNLELEQVPHFRLYDTESNRGKIHGSWFNVFVHFFRSMGYEFEYYLREWKKEELKEEHSINGYFYAGVESKTFENVKHAVIINLDGVVVHDPNPNKAWLNINVLESKELDGWYCFSKIV